MRKDIVKLITKNAIVAAIYFLFTILTGPFSFGVFQVRLAEFLLLLCFFNKNYIVGISVGCFLANLLGNVFTGETFGIIDAIVGTFATILSCVGISFMKKLFLATLIPVFVNGFIIGLELYLLAPTELSYFAYVGFVALGEFVAVSLIGYLIFTILKNNGYFLKLIDAKQIINE